MNTAVGKLLEAALTRGQSAYVTTSRPAQSAEQIKKLN